MVSRNYRLSSVGTERSFEVSAILFSFSGQNAQFTENKLNSILRSARAFGHVLKSNMACKYVYD